MQKPERYFYPAIFSYQPNKKINVLFPDLNCTTTGSSDEEAFLSACKLLGYTICELEENNKKLPVPTPLSELEVQPKERAVLIDVYMPSVRQAHINRSVNRTVTLPAWLNTAALERNINFSQVLQEALKQQLHLN